MAASVPCIRSANNTTKTASLNVISDPPLEIIPDSLHPEQKGPLFRSAAHPDTPDFELSHA